MGLKPIDQDEALALLLARGEPSTGPVFSALRQAFPDFADRWKKHVASWGGHPAGSYVGGQGIWPNRFRTCCIPKTAKTTEAQKVLEEQLGQFYRGIFGNDALMIQAQSAIQKPETVALSLMDSARQQLKKAEIYFPHEVGPCPAVE